MEWRQAEAGKAATVVVGRTRWSEERRLQVVGAKRGERDGEREREREREGESGGCGSVSPEKRVRSPSPR